MRSVLGRVVPAGRLPADVGVICLNVATTAEIGRLLPHGRGIVERVVTVAGPLVRRPGNYRVPIGTPLAFLLGQVGLLAAPGRVVLGGPMMGRALADPSLPVTKGLTGVLAFPPMALPAEQPCIRCGRCVQACPVFLAPCDLVALARSGRHAEMRERHRLDECFECGACAWVCPAHIPLVQHLRAAKAALRRAAA